MQKYHSNPDMLPRCLRSICGFASCMITVSDESIITTFHKATDELLKLRPSERRRELLMVLDKACRRGDVCVEYRIIEGE